MFISKHFIKFIQNTNTIQINIYLLRSGLCLLLLFENCKYINSIIENILISEIIKTVTIK